MEQDGSTQEVFCNTDSRPLDMIFDVSGKLILPNAYKVCCPSLSTAASLACMSGTVATFPY